MRRALAILLFLALAACALVEARVPRARADPGDKGVLAGFLSQILSSPGMQVSIGAVDGALSSNAVVRNVTISDAQGPWLKVDRIKIDWTRSALLSRRLQIDDLAIGRVDVLRRPLKSERRSATPPTLPELPVKVVVGSFSLGDLRLEAPVLGTPADVTASGHASLGDPRQGLDLAFDARRTDAPGSFSLRLTFAPSVQKLTVALDGHEPAGGLAARLLALPGLPPVELSAHASGVLDDLQGGLALTAGSDLSAHGDLRLTRDGSARKLSLSLVARLAALAPAALRPFFVGDSRLDASLRIKDDGSIDLDRVAVAAAPGTFVATGSVDAKDIDVDATLDASVGRRDFAGGVRATLRLSGARSNPTLVGHAVAAKALLFGRTVSDAAVDFSVRDVAATLAAQARFSARAQGTPTSGSVVLSQQGNGAWRLSPLKLAFGHSALEGDLTISADRLLVGRLNLDRGDLRDFSALLGERLTGSASGQLDFAAADGSQTLRAQLRVAEFRGSGLAFGEARLAAGVSGSLSEPRGDWRLDVRGASAVAMQTMKAPSIDARAKGSFVAGGSQVEADLSAGSAAHFHVAGFAPFGGRSGLDLKAVGSLDAALAAPFLPDGDRFSGRAQVGLSVKGSLAKPIVAGSVTLQNGAASDAASNLRLAAIFAHLAVSGDRLTIDSFSARSEGGGTIRGAGAVRLNSSLGFPGEVKISGRDVRAGLPSLATARADFDLDVAGSLARRPKVSGRVNFLSMEIDVPDRLPARLQPLPGLKHVAPGRAAEQMLALIRKRRAQRRAASVDLALDLDIAAADRIFVRGRGLDAEFGGRLHLEGTLAKPAPKGAFELRRGALDFLGKRFALTRGRLAFAGGLDPDVDVEAQTSTPALTARIDVKGPADAPAFTVSSTPALPQDEILSQILFSRPAGGLSPFQLIQLANAAAELSGRSNYLGALGTMRKALGVDSLDVQSDANGNPLVGVSRNLNDRLSLGVTSGAKPQDNAVSLGLDVSRHIRAQGQIGADGSSAVGLGMQWNY